MKPLCRGLCTVTSEFLSCVVFLFCILFLQISLFPIFHSQRMFTVNESILLISILIINCDLTVSDSREILDQNTPQSQTANKQLSLVALSYY